MDIIVPTIIAAEIAAADVTLAGGTYYDRNGLMQTAAAGALRVTYDPSDLTKAPYALLEPVAATNLFLNSDDMTLQSIGANIVYQGTTDGPAGRTGYRFVSSTNGNSYVRQSLIGSAANTTYTFSYWLRLPSGAPAGTFYAQDIANGVTRPIAVAATTNWQRISVTFTTGGAPGDINFHVGAVDSPAGYKFDIAMPMVVVGDLLSSYVASGATPATRPAETLGSTTGLLYSNVVESDAIDGPRWLSTNAYVVDNKVRRPNHRVYRALKAVAAGGAAPETLTSGTTPTWQDIGPTKRWSVFDNTYATTASAADEVTYVLRPGAVTTALSVLGADASEARVSLIDAVGNLVYQKTKILRIKNSRSITDYCFRPITRRRDEVFDDIPPFKSGTVCITVRKLGSTAAVADIVVGRLEDIGDAQWKPEIRTLRRSVITDDGFGTITFQKRRSSKLITTDVAIDNARVDDVVRLLDDYTDAPCVIIGDARWTSLIILGFVQDFRLVLDSPAGSLYNAQIQGFA